MAVKSIVTSITLPRVLKEELDAYAEKSGMPMAAIVRIALIAYLDKQQEKQKEKHAA